MSILGSKMALLEVENIHSAYGPIRVLFGVSLQVSGGEVVSLLGRNGVGKSTTIRSIMGLTPPHRGQVRWRGEDITGRAAHLNAQSGIGFVPEDRRIFSDLTVWENLDVGRRSGDSGHGWDENRVYELFPDLADIQDRKGGVLSGGQQQMLTIGRCLMGNPDLLLLDEPAEGLAPLVVENMRQKISQLKSAGLAIVLAEQNLNFALSLSDRTYVLEKGEVKFSGTSEELHASEAVQKAYLTV